MATTSLTSNLKLRISSDLTASSKYNLQQIDTLGSLYQVDTNEVAKVRSKTDMLFQTNDPDIGGTGSGGTVQFGTVDQPLSILDVNASSINLTGTLLGTQEINSTVGFSSTQGVPFKFPVADGSATQVLTTDGNGQLFFSSATSRDGQALTYDSGSATWIASTLVSAVGIETAYTWIPGDGDTKTIIHNLGTRQVIATVLDSTSNYQTIEVPDTTRPDDNTIILNATSGPTGGNWLVLLKQIIT
jgi:hypothetical protein